MNSIPRSFFQRNTIVVAQELVGKLIVRQFPAGNCVVRIVETEGYLSNDPACHAANGKTLRNQSLFGPVGHAYVYLSYGLHYCLNIVARDDSVEAGGVLIRAVEPIMGIELMHFYRPNVVEHNLTNGPGKLTKALSINRTFDGYDLVQGIDLKIAEDSLSYSHVTNTSSRIGISKAVDQPWRFYSSGNRFVSRG